MIDLSIMYSGGLDSLISYHYARDMHCLPICINVDMGQRYNWKEYESFDMINKWIPQVEMLQISRLVPLIESRMSNQIIPSRNVLLAVIGSMFSPRVWINALDGEQMGKEHDKSEKFFEDTTKLLSYTNEFFQPHTIVESPFMHLSKSEVIKWALDYGIPVSVLTSTSSCYSEFDLKCGKCLTCVKRYMAFLDNGIKEEGYTIDPLQSDYFASLCVEIPKAIKNNDYSRFTPKRAQEFMNFCEKHNVSTDLARSC